MIKVEIVKWWQRLLWDPLLIHAKIKPSVFRAIENGMWYVRAGNTGFTAIIDPYGRVVKSIPILEKGYLVGGIQYDLNHDTVYSKVGDLFLYFVFMFLSIIVIILLYKKIKKGV